MGSYRFKMNHELGEWNCHKVPWVLKIAMDWSFRKNDRSQMTENCRVVTMWILCATVEAPRRQTKEELNWLLIRIEGIRSGRKWLGTASNVKKYGASAKRHTDRRLTTGPDKNHRVIAHEPTIPRFGNKSTASIIISAMLALIKLD